MRKKGYSNWRLLILLCCLISFCSCFRNSQNGLESTPDWFQHYKYYNEKEYDAYFLNSIDKLTDEEIIFSQQIKDFYEDQKGPYWTKNGFQDQRITSFVEFLSQSYEDGVPSATIGYDTIAALIAEIRSGEIGDAETLYADLARLDIDLTAAYIQYAKALAYGATDPKVVFGKKWFYAMDTIRPQFIERTLAATDTAVAYLQTLQPTDSNYVALRKELKKYLTLKDTQFTKIPYIVATKNSVAKNVHMIGERLLVLQEINGSYHPSDTLTAQLMRALNRFRENRAIPVSNELDEETIDALNWQPMDYINKLVVNMDAYRWRVAPQKGPSFVCANIPDYTLQAWDADTFALKMRICCGKHKAYDKPVDTYKKNGILPPRESETPMLYSEINYIALNPEWKIPPKIIKDEYYSKMVNNSARVISREKLYVIDGRTNKRVVPETINWKNVNQKNIPYSLIQTSGKHNSLGLVKFNFPNSESVYIHDTNNKGAFKRRTRALSHGCVRVEKPIELATLLFRMNGYEDEDLEKVMIILGEEPTSEEGEEFLEKRLEDEQKYFESLGADTIFYRPLRPTNKMLKKRMPVYFEYHTCFVNETGAVQYRPDVYLKEENILTEMGRVFRY